MDHDSVFFYSEIYLALATKLAPLLLPSALGWDVVIAPNDISHCYVALPHL